MPCVPTTIDELFNGPWGITEGRRRDVEAGKYGSFQKIYQAEVDRHFLSLPRVAAVLGCHKSTARTWLREVGARYVIPGRDHLYFRPDVERAKAMREARKPSQPA